MHLHQPCPPAGRRATRSCRARADVLKQHMDNPVIPQEVARFILDHIDSIAQLEALLLLRSSPDTWWECKQAAERLYISEENCLPILERQCARGLLLSEKVGGKSAYRYRPKTGDLREMVDRLAYYYSK